MMSQLAQTLHQLLAELGPMSEDQLRAEARRAGFADDPAAISLILHDDAEMPPIVCLADGRLAILSTLLHGRVFTHRVTAAEIADDVLIIDPDLSVLTPMLEYDGVPLAGGGRLDLSEEPHASSIGETEYDTFELDDGTLRDYAPGDLIGIRVLDDDTMDLQSVRRTAPHPDDLAEHAQGMLTMLARRHAKSAGDLSIQGADFARVGSVGEMIEQWCADDPTLFQTPLAPVSELFSECGLKTDEGQVAERGFDFERLRMAETAGFVAAIYGISDVEAFNIALLASAVRGDTPGDGGSRDASLGDVFDNLAGSLGDPNLASAVFAETVGNEVEPAAGLLRIIDDREPRISEEAQVGLRWLRAQCLERTGRVAEAEQELESALDLGPHWSLALDCAARYASDRGDAARAVALLERSGLSRADPKLTRMKSYLSPPRGDTGRNKPCWCGSGRKYKVCHLGREDTPLESRAGWLYDKALSHLVASPYLDDLSALTPLIHEGSPERSMEGTGGEYAVLADAVLFEGGAFRNFLDEREFLLPHDEQLLAAQWLTVRRSVFEVERISHGQGFSVRDVRTGDRLEVSDAATADQLSTGDHVTARIVPVGSRHEIFGGIELLPPPYIQPAITLMDALEAGEADAADLVDFLASRFEAPTLETSDDEPMVQCQAVYEISDVHATREALDFLYGGDDDGTWIADDEDSASIPTVLGTMTIDGSQLHMTSMSEARFDRILADLEQIDTLSLVDSQRAYLDQDTSERLGQLTRDDEDS